MKTTDQKFNELYTSTANKEEVCENKLEYGLPFNPENNSYFNFELEDVIKRTTDRAVLVNITRFKNDLFNNKDIWVPRSACLITDDGILLEIYDWFLELKNEELKPKIDVNDLYN